MIGQGWITKKYFVDEEVSKVMFLSIWEKSRPFKKYIRKAYSLEAKYKVVEDESIFLSWEI